MALAPQKSTDGGGLREMINRKPGISGTIAAVVVLIILFLAFKPASMGKFSGFYTTDDGKNYFPLTGDHFAPFQHEGKEAVTAMVYACNGKQFVGYLVRYTPEGKTQAEEEAKHRDDPRIARSASGAMFEVKKPGDKVWVRKPQSGGPPEKSKQGQPTYQSITDVRCPDGTLPVPVTP